MDGSSNDLDLPERGGQARLRRGRGAGKGGVAGSPDSYRGAPPTDTVLAEHLLAQGLIDAATLAAARQAQTGAGLSLSGVLAQRGALSEADLLSALSTLNGLSVVDLKTAPPDPGLAKALDAELAATSEVVPWRRAGGALVVATSRPDKLAGIKMALQKDAPRLRAVLATQADVLRGHSTLYGAQMARRAESRVPRAISCRRWKAERLGQILLASALVLVTCFLLAPALTTALVFGGAIAVFTLNLGLKIAALRAMLRPRTKVQPDPRDPSESQYLHLPTVSLLVPLYREPDVAHALIERLCRLDYPRERLDILLVVEEDDRATQNALTALHLPPWMRMLVVPDGQPRTKPRALNYALTHARGSIVGIYDAEDRPDPDQIHRIVLRFAEVPPDVACLQGRLDYYNASHNLLSRLFTIEYASWFRVLLPGVQRLGLVVPLGGTTLFLRRHAIEQVGGWDAHNVTEDAELGLRLARAGYRTELVDTTTYEEANAAVLPWIRQRSRWIKGYVMTWGAAMQTPRTLGRDLGWLRANLVHVQFLGAFLGYLLAPLLWSFGVKAFGLWHPMDRVLGMVGYRVLGGAMLGGLAVSVTISLIACNAAHLRPLRKYVLVIEPYHLLGSVAAWLALAELMLRPFFWAKTAHGAFGASQLDAEPTAGARVRTARGRLHAVTPPPHPDTPPEISPGAPPRQGGP